MTKFNTIPKGYKLTVTTWENDADNYRTETISGISKEEVHLFLDFCNLFSEDDKLNNLFEPSDEEIEYIELKIQEINEKHKETIDRYKLSVEDILYDLGLFGTEFYTRVVESFMVEYVPEDIKIEDVTKQFK